MLYLEIEVIEVVVAGAACCAACSYLWRHDGSSAGLLMLQA
jgi:hypothetical protein